MIPVIPDDLSIPEFLRRPMTPEARAAIDAQIERSKRSRHETPRLRRRRLSDEKATELRIEDEARRRWHSWIPTKEEHHRPRLATFERLVRDEFKAKVSAAGPVAPAEESVVGKAKTKKTSKTKKPPRAAKPADTVMADPPQTGGVRPGSKLAAIVELLQREGGCTTKDVLAATGWPSVSMPQQAKAAGLTLRKEKVDGVTRYSVAA